MDWIKKYKITILTFIISVLNILFLYLVGYECPWKKYFDIDCAGCGATRMVIALLHFEFYQAFRYNPLMFVLLILTIFYLLYLFVCKIINVSFYKFNSNWLWALLIIIVLFTIVRNVPGFEYLKPTKL